MTLVPSNLQKIHTQQVSYRSAVSESNQTAIAGTVNSIVDDINNANVTCLPLIDETYSYQAFLAGGVGTFNYTSRHLSTRVPYDCIITGADLYTYLSATTSKTLNLAYLNLTLDIKVNGVTILVSPYIFSISGHQNGVFVLNVDQTIANSLTGSQKMTNFNSGSYAQGNFSTFSLSKHDEVDIFATYSSQFDGIGASNVYTDVAGTTKANLYIEKIIP